MTVEPQAEPSVEPDVRKAWSRPEHFRLRSGSAENIPGDAIFDNSLENTGS